jgi:hypothetical protein
MVGFVQRDWRCAGSSWQKFTARQSNMARIEKLRRARGGMAGARLARTAKLFGRLATRSIDTLFAVAFSAFYCATVSAR